MKINTGYILIKELTIDSLRDRFYMPKNYDGESRFAEVLGTNSNSIFSVGDIILHEKDIRLFTAQDLGEDKFYILEREITSKIIDNTILSVRDFVYVKAQADSKHTLDYGNFKLKIDSEFNKFSDDIVTRSGIVMSVPSVATNSYTGDSLNIDIKKGDEIYTHHFLTHEQHETEINGEKVYEIRYEDCYCVVRDGNIIMLNEWNLIEPIKEDESEFTIGNFKTKFELGNDSKKGILKYPSKSINLNSGSLVYFKRNRDYEITVDDKKYFRVNTRDIVANKIN